LQFSAGYSGLSIGKQTEFRSPRSGLFAQLEMLMVPHKIIALELITWTMDQLGKRKELFSTAEWVSAEKKIHPEDGDTET